MSDPDICRAHGLGDEEINLRRHHADNGGRARGGGRGGRGGGFVGSRSRVSGPKRYVTAVQVKIHANTALQSSGWNSTNRHPNSCSPPHHFTIILSSSSSFNPATWRRGSEPSTRKPNTQRRGIYPWTIKPQPGTTKPRSAN